MDDLTGKLAEMLNNPETMEQLKGFAGMLGQSASQKEEPEDIPNTSSIPPDTMNTVMKLLPLLSSMNQEDKSTRLLQALRPFLGKERKKKLDEANKLLQMIRLLPLLKSSGIL